MTGDLAPVRDIAPAKGRHRLPEGDSRQSRRDLIPHTWRAFAVVAAVATVVVPTIALLDTTGVLGASLSQALDDLGQLVAGGFATVACGLTARRAVLAGRPRAAWLWRLLLFLGLLGWTCGQAIWSWYQVVEGQELPSPSLADVGYFALPVFALPAVLTLPAGPAPHVLPTDLTGGRPRDERRGHRLLGLDAVVIVGSLLLLTWSTTLGAAVRASAPTAGAFLIAVGYPVTDLILVVIVLLTAVFRRPQRPLALLLLGAGLVALSVSDSFFLYLVSVGATGMPPLYNIGFQAGPVLIGLAALTPEPALPQPQGSPVDARAATWFTLVPFLPLGMIGLLVVVQQLLGQALDGVEAYGLILLVGTVASRQLLTMLENLDLLRQLHHGQERLRHQAFHDWLTGLPNRALFRERLEEAVEQHRHEGRQLALLFCDLDDFKRVNDTRGHATGDELLRIAAQRLTACAGPTDTVARLGGDEFAVILTGQQDVATVAQRMLDALDEPVMLGGRPHVPQASAGLVAISAGEREVTAARVLHRADAAMYAAKRGGKGRLVTYRPGLEADHPASVVEEALSEALGEALAQAALAQAALDQALDQALDGAPVASAAVTMHLINPMPGSRPAPPAQAAGAGLRLLYQPIVRLDDGGLVAVEALARWDHPRSGPVSPQVLVAVAESCDLLDQLDDLILDLACRDIALIRAGSHPHVAVHVNVGAARATESVLVEHVRAALMRHRLPGEALVLEVTEGGRIGDLVVAGKVLHDLRRLGVQVALDDFGSGNSNLAYLLELPIDLLKLDRALTVASPGTGRAQAISAGAIEIGLRLGIPMIAEGVEERAQAERLAGLGCEYGQGYLFARPLPAIEVTAIPQAGVTQTG